MARSRRSAKKKKLLTGELKFKDKFSFVCRVVPVLLCNNVPNLADVSNGMLRRLQVIPFDRVFTDKTANAGLFDRVWADELPGVLNRAIQGWQRLHKRGGFKLPKPIQQAKSHWLVYANPLMGFIDERCTEEPGASTLLETFYTDFCKWAIASGIHMGQRKAGVKRDLEHQGFTVKKGRRGQEVLGLKLSDVEKVE